MKKKNKILVWLLALTMVLGLMACKGGGTSNDTTTETEEPDTKQEETAADTEETDTKETDTIKIAFIGTTNTDESIIFFAEKVVEEAKRIGGIEVTVFDPNNDVQKQANMVDDAIADKYDGIIVIPVDMRAFVPAAKNAHEAGLKVVMLASDIDESGWDYRDAVVTADQYLSGKLAAEAIIEQFPEGAKGVIVEGNAGELTSDFRSLGFEETIAGTGITVLDKKAAQGWDAAKALSITEDFLQKYGDEIDFIYSHWDNGSTAIVQALENKGMLEDVYIVSIDGCREGLKLVNDEKIAITIYQDIPAQSYGTVQAMVKLLNGETIDPVIEYIPWQIVTKENADFDPGW